MKFFKYKSSEKNLFYVFDFLLVLFSFIKICKLIPQLKNPRAINLSNNKILVIHQDGIDIYDSYFNSLIQNINNFSEGEKIDQTKATTIRIARFSEEDDGYIISIINDQIYIFDSEGNKMYLNEIISQTQNYYEILPIKKENNTLNYMVSYLNNSNYFHFYFYEYDISNKTNILLPSNDKFNTFKFKYDNQESDYDLRDLSCQLMTKEVKNYIIVCFIAIKTPKRYITQFFIDPNNHQINSNESQYVNYSSSDQAVKYLKSFTNLNKKKSLICFYLHGISGFCTIYSIKNNSFTDLKDFHLTCIGEYRSINLFYMNEKKQYLFACINTNDNLTMIILDETFNYFGKSSTKDNGALNGFSIIYSQNSSSPYYYIISKYENNKNNLVAFSIIEDRINDNSNEINSTFLNTHSSTVSSIITEKLIISNTSFNTKSTIFSTSIKSDFSTIAYSITSFPSNTFITTLGETSSFTSVTYSTTIPKISTIVTMKSTNIKINQIDSTILSSIYQSSGLKQIYSNIISESTELIHIENIDILKENLKEQLPSIINKTEIGKIYQKEGKDYTIFIYPTNSTYLSSVTHVNFSECEAFLRSYYHISNSTIITFLQIELKNENSQSLINQVEYEAYDENKTLLNLSLCKDIDIEVVYFVKNNTSTDFNKASDFQKYGIDVFNINDSFFNDICKPSPDNEDDLILEDRVKDIYKNYTLCEDGCIYKRIDLENMAIYCECKVKDNITMEILPVSFDDIEISSTNFEVIKCYNLVFSLEGKFKNIGFWILGILYLLHVPILAFYFKRGINPIRQYIITEMKEYGYINVGIKTTNKRKNKKEASTKISGKTRAKTNKKKYASAPPKNRNEKIIIKNMQIIDNTSSINILPINKEIVTNINSKKKKSTNKKSNKKENKMGKSTKKLQRMKTKTKTKIKNKNISSLPTQTFSINNKSIISEKEFEKNKNLNIYKLININLNIINKKKYVPPDSHIILNNYTFKEAIKYDQRQTCVIFYIFALSKQIFFHTFLFSSPLEIFPLRLCLFIFIISSDLSLNALFYFNDNISKKYRRSKSLFLFTFNDNITIILLSTFVGFILFTFLAYLSNSTNKIRDIFRIEEEKLQKEKKYIVTENKKKEILFKIEEILIKYKCRIIFLIIIELILMGFFWYFVIAFCHVYKATQMSWLLDSLLSILIRAIIELLLCFGLAKLYRIAIAGEVHCLYKFIMLLYNLG